MKTIIFEWRKTRIKNKNQKQESKTKVEATYVIVILYLQLVVFSWKKQTPEQTFELRQT